MSDITRTARTQAVARNGVLAFDCGGAEVRAQFRHLAIVVTIAGRVDSANIDRVSKYIRRFTLAETSVVLDLSAVESYPAGGARYLCELDEDCCAAGVEWALVASPAVYRRLSEADAEATLPLADSVPEALHDFAEEIGTRRMLLLPLLRKTA